MHNRVIRLETGLTQGADESAVNIYEIRAENGRILLEAARLQARPGA